MKKIFLLCIACCCLFFVLPTVVHGENIGTTSESTNSKEERKSPNGLLGILTDTTKSIELVVQESVNITLQTSTDLSEPLSKPTTSSIEDTGNLLNKTVENSVTTLVETVTETLSKTTSGVTNTVNDTVNSVVYELPPIPVVTPIVNEVSKTVEKTTSSVQDLVEKTRELVNGNKEIPNGPSKDDVVENNDIVHSEDKIMNPPHEIIQNEEKTIIEDGNFDSNPSESLPVITLLAEIETVELVKQDETSNLEEYNEIEMVINDGDKLFVDSKSEETSKERHTIVKEFSVVEQIVNPKKDMKTVYNSSHPSESNNTRGILPTAIITVTSPATASLILLLGGQSDSLSVVTIDVFKFISTKGRQWIHNDENAKVQWTHAPPGRPPLQSPFLKM
ncbi:hypothetical protein [Psychrobacillus sp. NPDC096389]|uniref:hypothetical protein n=1 Tax=Psychrobacillus sp. NPDC096389 TaxID=3364490 RepID=UPI00381AF1EA